MFLKTDFHFSGCFAHIKVITVYTGDIVHYPTLVSFVSGVFGFYKEVPEGVGRLDESVHSMFLENSL